MRLLFVASMLIWFSRLYLSNKAAVVYQVTPLDGADSRALMDAATLGNKKQVAALLKKGLPINTKDQQGNTALIYAAQKGHEKSVQLLIDQGALTDHKLKFWLHQKILLWVYSIRNKARKLR
ncbi:ankyrin repeat domain-containing protein [Cardinium endosymbiont of Dermatophagoides farinae]|uniref:ankyrin repeat domain-containing protein n=1 Tax=Cardinium endosymbiont of Dermatophagoides farinae TaxID=2597823 RepID=UPI001CB93A0F|nr:ankyrin repeat domain-containing protein [Cardinium endosymbiont of Dermatophagoides farinae]